MSSRNTRARILEAADRLFYQNGYETTSFADIAEEVKISRGNFYYHFKTKDEILDDVIEMRVKSAFDATKMWDANGETPEEQMCQFVEAMMNNKANIAKFGCPVGTLCSELSKISHYSRDKAAEIYTIFKDWMVKKCHEIGFASTEAEQVALSFMGRCIGATTLAHAFNNEQHLDIEGENIKAWFKTQVRSLNLKKQVIN